MTTIPIPAASLEPSRTGIVGLLATSMGFSCMLVALRILHTGSTLYIYMVWNLFLACIPYAISTWLTASARIRQPLARLLIFLVWLLFLPNSFYILTDLYHLTDSRHPRVPEWYDLALIFSFAWNGLLLGILSLRQMEKYGRPQSTLKNNWLFIVPVMALNALGVYVGRYLRYNSWDILSNPFQLISDITGMITHPFRNQYAWDMILCYTTLLIFIYSMMKKIGRSLT
jgi:uncharacterized membrane protein